VGSSRRVEWERFRFGPELTSASLVKSEDRGLGDGDDSESIRAIHAGLDRCVNFLGTASNHGCGHSEPIVGRAISARRSEVVLASCEALGLTSVIPSPLGLESSPGVSHSIT